MKKQYHDKLIELLDIIVSIRQTKDADRLQPIMEVGNLLKELWQIYLEYFQYHIEEAWQIIDEFTSNEGNRQALIDFDKIQMNVYSEREQKKNRVFWCEWRDWVHADKPWVALSIIEAYNYLFTEFIFSFDHEKYRLQKCGTHYLERYLDEPDGYLMPLIEDAPLSEIINESPAIKNTPESHWWWNAKPDVNIIDQKHLHKGLALWAERILHRTFGRKELRNEKYLANFIKERNFDVQRYDYDIDHYEMERTEYSPLMIAVLAGDMVLAKALLENLAMPDNGGCDLRLKPIEAAEALGNKEMIDLLIYYGA